LVLVLSPVTVVVVVVVVVLLLLLAWLLPRKTPA